MNRRSLLWIWKLSLLACLVCPQPLIAETAMLEVYHLPLNEAEAAVKTQLSKNGSVTILSSRRTLIINDESRNIQEARKLLKQLDVAAPQYSVYLKMLHFQNSQLKATHTEAVLPGGWIRLNLEDKNLRSSNKQSFNLHLSANHNGSIEVGTLQPYRKHIRQWLANYGLISSNSVDLVSVTSGFIARVRPADSGHVHIRITPWMRNQRGRTNIEGKTEILIDLGTTTAPLKAPSRNAPIRLNANPSSNQNKPIEIAGAVTELTIPLGKTIAIMANDKESEMFGEALLSSSSNIGSNRFAIKLRIEQH